MYISFVDLIHVITMFSHLFLCLENYQNKAESDYEPFYGLIKRLLALDLCFAAKIVLNMAFFNLDLLVSISKRMKKSSWTHLFFWCIFFLSIILF